MDYLKEITRNHRRAGSKISPTKHSISKYFVKYCEKILEFNKFKDPSWTPRTINNSTEEYIKSPFIDSVKVRLLSPCSKNNDNFNDRNTAIGKGKSLGRTLRWLNTDLFSKKWVRMVRDRFFQRMGSHLPDSSSGVYWHLLLPEIFGGLGLWLENDIVDLPFRLPEPSKTHLLACLDGTISTESKKLFRGFTSNLSYRGYSLLETETTLVREYLIDELIPILESKTLREVIEVENLKDKPQSNQFQIAKRRGWLTRNEIEDSILRPFLWKEILSNEAKVCAFNTETFKVRYHKLWDLTYRGQIIIDEDTIKRALKFREQELFYDCRAVSEIPIRGRIRKVNLIEECTIGLPDLKIQWNQIGILTSPIDNPPQCGE